MRLGMMPMRRPFFATVAAIITVTASPARAADCKLHLYADLPVTMADQRATVPVQVNGTPMRFWLDSGAFFSIMSKAKAAELNLPLSAAPYGFYITGIGGRADVQIGTVRSFGIVGQELKNIQFLVGGSDSGGALIGRNLLAIADTEFDLAHGSVKLIRSEGCDKKALAYWAVDKPYFTVPLLSGSTRGDRLFRLPVNINGARITAEYDTGAPTSLLSRKAAEQAGIDLSSPDVTPVGNIGGFGQHVMKGWIVPIKTIDIGDEQILRSHIRVIDGPIMSGNDVPDMLIGADYMLAHHIYVARNQRRIYFTYSGGRPFLAKPSTSPSGAGPITLPEGKYRVEAVDNPGAAPKTADEYARRGNVRMAQQNYAGAIADLTEAIRLAPDEAAYYADRAQAYDRSGQQDKSRADIDKALTIDLADADLLRIRAHIRFAERDMAGALADAEAAMRGTHAASLDAASLASLFERLGQPQRAIVLFDGVIAHHRADSKLGGLLNGRCWARALANSDLDKALADCNAAIKRDGARPFYLDSRALVYFRKGDHARALADCDAAIKGNPQMHWSLFVRGLIKTAQGDADGGKVDRAAAVAIMPDIVEQAQSYGIEA